MVIDHHSKIGILHFNNERLNSVHAGYNLKVEDRVFLHRKAYERVVGRETVPRPAKDPTRLPEEDFRNARSWVLFKDDHFIAINKPSGLACQGGTNQERHLGYFLPALKYNFEEEPRLVHRLDKDTSGVLLLARTRQAAADFQSLLKGQRVHKTYHAIVVGRPTAPSGTLKAWLRKGKVSGQERMILETDLPEGADITAWKAAVTHYQLEDKPSGPLAALMRLNPQTGRTHQLRVMLSRQLGTPIVGDVKYAQRTVGQAQIERQTGIGELPLCLHATSLAFVHPHKSTRRQTYITAPFPQHMKKVLVPLKGYPRELVPHHDASMF